MLNFLDELGKNYDGKRVMIIGHRATQCGLDQWVKGMQTANAVTAPWKWQPGWTYYHHVVPVPYKVRMGYVTLSHELHELPPIIGYNEKTFYLKREFHISLICVKLILPQLIAKLGDEAKANTLLAQSLTKVLEDYQPTFGAFTGELRTAQEKDKETIVAMCTVTNLDHVFQDLSSLMSLEFEPPPTHVTLYTLENKKAIGIPTNQELDILTRPMSDSPLTELMHILAGAS